MPGALRRWTRPFRVYAKLGRLGLGPHVGSGRTTRVVWAVIRSERGVVLTVRSDLRGWELPGGTVGRGEPDEEALLREVREETGLDVAVVREVGEYANTGFLPNTARVYECRVRGGTLRPSPETPRVRWFDPQQPPRNLFPWYRGPLADALAGGPPVRRRVRWGLRDVAAGLAIDLRMRLSGDRAG